MRINRHTALLLFAVSVTALWNILEILILFIFGSLHIFSFRRDILVPMFVGIYVGVFAFFLPVWIEEAKEARKKNKQSK